MNRVRQTMDRIRLVLSGKLAERSNADSKNLNKNVSRKLLFKNNSKFVYLNLDDIIYITKEGRKTTIYFIGGQIKTNDKLSALEEQLEGYPFFRSHSGFIVNLKMVKELIPASRSSYELVMENTKNRPLITVENLRNLKN